jgi:hypothetical protein
MKTKVLITIEGGIVQSVVSNIQDIEIIIVDYDDHADEPVVIDGPKAPDHFFVDTKAYRMLYSKHTNKSVQKVRRLLKKIGF